MTQRLVLALAAVLALGAAPYPDRAAPIGQAYFEVPEAPGTVDPRAQDVAEGEIFRAGVAGAVVHLDNGASVRFIEGSAARLEAVGQYGVQVTVLAGHVMLLDDNGRRLGGGSGSVFEVGPSYADPLDVEQQLLGVAVNDPADPGRRVLLREDDRPDLSLKVDPGAEKPVLVVAPESD